MAELANRTEAEANIGGKLGRLSARHKRELISLMGTPPRAENVPEEFWEKVRRETENEMKLLLFLIFAASATQHGLDTSRAETLATGWSGRRAGDFARDWTQNSREQVERASQKWAEQEAETGKPTTKQEAAETAEVVFSSDRADRAAVTEVTNASVDGGESGVSQTDGLSEDDTWYTVNDSKVCPICDPLHGAKRSEWSRLFPNGPGAHPNCRCWIEYAREKQGAAT